MITRNFILHLTAGLASPLVINVNQYDQGEQWLFTLYNQDGTQYTPSSGAIVGIKSDNLGIINSGSVDSQGRVVINETQQMTAAVGKAVFELLIDDQTHGTANFIVLVEPKPGDNADLSESDYSLFQQAIDGTSATAIAEGVADWMDENLTPTTPVVDASLTVQGAAADSAKVGQELSDLKSQITNSMPYEVKQAMDNMLAHALYKDYDSSSDYAIYHAWANTLSVVSISAVFTQGDNDVYLNTPLSNLRQYLVVTATFDNSTSAVVTTYELSGTLTAGTSTVIVSYGGQTTTFTVNVTNANDVTPDLSTVDDSASSKVHATYNSADGSIRVYTSATQAYAGAKIPFVADKTYTYRINYDAVYTSGAGRIVFADSAGTIRAGWGSGCTFKSDDTAVADTGFVQSGSYYYTPDLTRNEYAVAQIQLMVTWSSNINGDITFKNIKVLQIVGE